MSSDVWFGIHASQEGCDFNDVKKYCLACEKHDLDTFTVMDHFMNQDPPYEKGKHSIEAWTLLGGLAASTSRIKLGTLVSCYAYRPPTVLAKMATTVDIISDGRLIYGIGAGWHKGEFEGYLGRFPSTGERLTGLEETAQISRNMFTQEVSSFEGKLYKVKDVLNSPPPIQSQVPILIGGDGEKRTLRIVAKYADISHIFPLSGPTGVKHKFDVLRRHCMAVGRDYDDIRKGVHFHLMLGDDTEIRRRYVEMARIAGVSYAERIESFKAYGSTVLEGSVDDVCSALRGYRGLGIGWYTFSSEMTSAFNDLDVLKDEIIPSIQS